MAEGNRQMELRDYIPALRRRKRLLLAIVGVFFLGAVVGSMLMTPVYAAEAQVLLERRSTESLFDTSSGQFVDPLRTIETEVRVVESYPVRLAVREKLGYDAKVSARSAGEANVMLVQAEHRDSRKAADIANAYATSYIELRRQEAVDDIQAAITQLQAKVTDLESQLASASGPNQEALADQLTIFKDKVNELQVNAALQTGGAQVATPAIPSETPVRPRPVRNAVLWLTVGAFVGIATVLVVDHLDDSLRSKEDLEAADPSLPVVGVIPAFGNWKAGEEPHLVSLTDPMSAPAEAFRTLRTSIQFPMLDSRVRLLQITSANAQEGKTTILANLAVALAGAGHRVVVVCCDLRRPRIHEFFGLGNASGFTSVVLGELSVTSALQPAPGVDRLYVLPSGPLPPNPSELLQSQRVGEVLRSLENKGTFVLIDSPPVLPVTDALVLSRRVDSTLLVCAGGRTSRPELRRAAELLRQVQAPLVGTVLNGVAGEAIYGYQDGYYGSGATMNGNGSKSSKRLPGKDWARARRTG